MPLHHDILGSHRRRPPGRCVNGQAAHLPAEHHDAFVLLCCWQLWKRRNGVIFRQETMTLRELLHQAREDTTLGLPYEKFGASS
ncbi:hypothetical protein HU200_039941 [Digitaria exilis]|uniref:Uncharacterized protein n=1 Tax=Digitaria exilis TaxID=1010633 RepID=A0A835BA60_9POAL|nr:hypothetical protein HU200_039941 [Digitaria exilis]